jgi:hypothetical protein
MTTGNSAADPSQKIGTEAHASQVAKPEVYIDDGGARFLLEKWRGSPPRLAKASSRALSTLPDRVDARDSDKRALQTCGTSVKCCQGSLCQDWLMGFVAGAAVGAVSQWLPGCDTRCRLDE